MNSELITDSNVQNVRQQIHNKLGSNPYIGTATQAQQIITDMDHQPYTRFYRGVYWSSDPVAMEREAGFRKVKNYCYINSDCVTSTGYPNNCFETACSTVYPCYTEYLDKFADKNALNVQINKACITQYR